MKRGAFIFGPSYYSLVVVVMVSTLCLPGLLNELHKHSSERKAKMTDKDGVIESRQQSSIKGSLSLSHAASRTNTPSDTALISLAGEACCGISNCFRLRQFDRSVSFSLCVCSPQSFAHRSIIRLLLLLLLLLLLIVS